MGYSWEGQRVSEISVDLNMTNEGTDLFRDIQTTSREWRVALDVGQKWPETCKRGRKIDFTLNVNGEVIRLNGTVKYRRLNRLVVLTE